MKHVTYADKSLMTGNAVADLLMEYAAALAARQEADTVHVHATSADGSEVVATFLLDAGAPIMVETTNSSAVEPDNADAENYMRQRLERLTAVPSAMTNDDRMPEYYDELGL